ncbi:MAG: hypothetical protein HXY49_03430 [Ignavibacteriaceae bacterium]|nr:hypothetical protein [Ignavibacteriaceae bacterium]
MQNTNTKESLHFDDQNYNIVEYSDNFQINGKKITIKGLGEKYSKINSFFLDYLKEYHIPTGFIRVNTSNSLMFVKDTRFPFCIKILNIIDKRTAKIFSKKEGDLLNLPVFEIHSGKQKESLITESHLIAFELATNEEIRLILRICSKINAVLKSFFERRNEILAEVCCYFGKNEDKIYLFDEFTPSSIKIFSGDDKNNKRPNPYKLITSNDMKKYTEHLFNLTSV